MKLFKLLPVLLGSLLLSSLSINAYRVYYEEPVYEEPGYYDEYYPETFGEAVTEPVQWSANVLESNPVTEPVGEVVEGAGNVAAEAVDVATSPLRRSFWRLVIQNQKRIKKGSS